MMIIYPDAVLPQHSSRLLMARGQRLCHSTTLLRVGFTRPACLHAAGELLPRLFILTFRSEERRAVFFSVALSLKSPSPDVIRHPCPVEPGLSSCIGCYPSDARDHLGLPRANITYSNKMPVQSKAVSFEVTVSVTRNDTRRAPSSEA
ncbi:hypothetical protein SAMN02910456_01053 [Ruminococcaceae bacterium YRB3002]|nr:hypothetical protein SAMN02910456_01053 [Ruminococcaceae bacterium YRB3002]